MQCGKKWRCQLMLWICLNFVVELCDCLLRSWNFKYVPEDQGSTHTGSTNSNMVCMHARSYIECGSLCMQEDRNQARCVGFIYQTDSSSCRLVANISDVKSSTDLGAAFAVIKGKESCPLDKGFQIVQYTPPGRTYCLALFWNAEISYSEAELQCRASGAPLFHFEGDMTKTDVATEFALDQNFTGTAFYVGLSDQITEGSWIWSYNMQTAVIPTSKWRYGRGPNNARGEEHCVVLLHPSGTLEDIGCDLPRAYMCEVLIDSF